MPTMEQLEAADRQHAADIAALRARVAGHGEVLERHETMLGKLNETVVVLREAVAKVATKDDILRLSQNIDNKFSTQMAQAQASIPAKIGVVLTGGSVVIALVALVASLASHYHG